MKKSVFILFFIGLMSTGSLIAQDTIVGWSFPLADTTSLFSNYGIVSNLGTRFIAAEDTGGVERDITFTNGVADYAATATHWDNGAAVKFWSIKFKAEGYENLTLYSKQRAGNTDAGPMYWKVQYRFSGGEYADIPGTDTIICGNNWTSGVLDNVALPAECSDTSASIYIRWIMLTNDNIMGGTVDSNGIGKIDDIFILGTLVPIGISEQFGDKDIKLYPNPANNKVSLSGDFNARVRIFDMVGKVVFEGLKVSQRMDISVDQFNPGLYFVQMEEETSGQLVTRKLIVN